MMDPSGARTGRDALTAALGRHLASGGLIVGEAVGCHGLTRSLTPGPGRMIRTPLSEAGSVATALGLALTGARVVVELVDGAGLARAAEALTEAASLAARSGGVWRPSLVVIAPEVPVALPGVPVIVAGTAGDLASLLEEAGRLAPAVLLCAAAALDGEVGEATPGVGPVVRRSGSRLTLVTAGAALPRALAAADEVEGVEVLELRALDPAVYTPALGESVRRSGRVAVLLAEATPLLSAVSEAFLSLESPPEHLPLHASPAEIAERLRASIGW